MALNTATTLNIKRKKQIQSPQHNFCMIVWMTESHHRLFNLKSWSAQLFWCMMVSLLPVGDLRSLVCTIMARVPAASSPLLILLSACNEPNIWPTSAAQCCGCWSLPRRGRPAVAPWHSNSPFNTNKQHVNMGSASERWILTFDCECLLANCFLLHHSSQKWFVCMCGLEKRMIGLRIPLLTSNSSEGISMKRGSTVRIFQSCLNELYIIM